MITNMPLGRAMEVRTPNRLPMQSMDMIMLMSTHMRRQSNSPSNLLPMRVMDMIIRMGMHMRQQSSNPLNLLLTQATRMTAIANPIAIDRSVLQLFLMLHMSAKGHKRTLVHASVHVC